jgi:hypothetical protein
MTVEKIWAATPELRFVEKPLQDGRDLKLLRILQQRWNCVDQIIDKYNIVVGQQATKDFEWRDVPLVEKE